MKQRLVSLTLLLTLLAAFVVVAPRQAAAAPVAQAAVSFNVTGTLAGGGTFTGTISNLRFAVNQAGQLVLNGVLNGTATLANGTVIPVVNQLFSVVTTVTNPAGGPCTILTLDIGRITLNLLGLVIDIAPISIDVTAVPGAGNLLGNLLCAVAGLLDNPGNPVNAIANLLNRILGLLS